MVTLRRLSYQATRDRVEDELVDVAIAAESLYLTDDNRQELSYRLSLRAAAFCDPRKLKMSRLQVFKLMKAAYQVRSNVVHGGEPKLADMKVRGPTCHA